jgi:hypothetical protein
MEPGWLGRCSDELSAGRSKRFPSASYCSYQLWDPNSAQGASGAVSQVIKRPVLESDHSPLSNAEILN